MDEETRAIYRNELYKSMINWLTQKRKSNSAAMCDDQFQDLIEDAVQQFFEDAASQTQKAPTD